MQAELELEPLGPEASPATAARHFKDPHVTTFDWVRKVLQTTPDEEVAAAGLDGWAFLEFRRLLWRIFSVIGTVLSAVLLPMHWQAGVLRNANVSHLQYHLYKTHFSRLTLLSSMSLTCTSRFAGFRAHAPGAQGLQGAGHLKHLRHREGPPARLDAMGAEALKS